MDHLTAGLLDLLHELEGQGIPITVGGGFGLYLKRRHLEKTGQRTLFQELPALRATNDLDLFLRVDVLADYHRTQSVAAAICRLGYTPVPTARFMQWVKQIPVNGFPQPLKIDLLVGPLGSRAADLDADERRARPKRKIEFHARRTEEALHLEDEPLQITVSGQRSTGDPQEVQVHVPQAFPYLMMKLHAFDDRRDDADKDLGRYHALDLYTIVGMMTEREYERAKQLGAALVLDDHVTRARKIVWDHFQSRPYGPPVLGAPWTPRSIQKGHYSPGQRGTLGLLRIREHDLFRETFLLQDFTNVLEEIFGIGS
jgi:hypothetical protein